MFTEETVEITLPCDWMTLRDGRKCACLPPPLLQQKTNMDMKA